MGFIAIDADASISYVNNLFFLIHFFKEKVVGCNLSTVYNDNAIDETNKERLLTLEEIKDQEFRLTEIRRSY